MAAIKCVSVILVGHIGEVQFERQSRRGRGRYFYQSAKNIDHDPFYSLLLAARAEWRLTGVQDGKLVNIAIDRTFVDANNVRWIIDFKTGSHEGGDVAAFLDNEQSRYRAQLDVYAAILNAMEEGSQPREIRLGLYFPMLKEWREWGWGLPVSR